MNLILIVSIYFFLLFRICRVNGIVSVKRNCGHERRVVVHTVSGFSLVEVLIVVAIMTVVLSMASLSFNAWSRGRNMESQLRELFVDLNDARAKAFHEKKTYRMTFQPNSYVLKSYSSDNEPRDKGMQTLSKNVSFTMTRKNENSGNMGADISDYLVDFNSNGLSANNFTVVINPLSNDPPLNCLVIFDSRVNMGKVNGSDCEFK